MTNTIFTSAEVESLPVGQWVIDADGTPLCLVDTNVGWPQRMWMHQGGCTFSAIDRTAYPLRLADVEQECPHSWGTNEYGHCRRCGAVVAAPENLTWNFAFVSTDKGGEL
ncbi:hypothetical protein GCM10012275_55010 [Longimycelium tulufanense]|uniref:Uncharacterized protein n=1 Tax=Longimycelium tulufanense TaxID=907463 RepID=A0A8J3FYN5_9PSEU|nr:hypothetical protein [Longimycelium tulufanense]GGM77335.1 hypothetical protein GCM10012275_55010 [Longimycelium tulufanense]